MDYELDLDELEPKSKLVKLCGRVVEVRAPRFKSLVAIYEVSRLIEKSEDPGEAMVKMREALLPIVPALADADIDISMTQLQALVQFVMKMAEPAETKRLEEEGITPADSQKKGAQSQEPSPTS